ncbi:DNA replication complex GINS protein Sld5 [Leptinotarsa decemlineata]|uniref:DNA replication complex GINS protein Sld5 n=1 Tax=Leptinotarsa decemlineata TaxID=7539 RepID=UPI000C252F7F|nr:DNA replication complex GINS protein SLD5 [Leptinotarsa decemlineata]
MDLENSETNMFNSDEDDEDHVQLTPAEVIELMEESWSNEKFAPEILPHKFEIVECLLDQITSMEGNIRRLNSTDFRKSIHQLEVDRLRFLVSSYLRTRLEKIECYVTFILKEEAKRQEKGEDMYLSEQEMKFAKDFSRGLEEYFDNVLSFYPGLPAENWSNQIIEPNNHSFVFLKSKKDIEGVIIDDGNDADNDLVDFSTGSRMIISYNSVANLVKNGDVHLI